MALQEIIEPVIDQLYYPSESDEPVEYFTILTEKPLPFSAEDLQDILPEEMASQPIEPLDIDTFWLSITEEKEWYSEEERQRTEKFKRLKHELDSHLSQLQGFRVGSTEIDIYLFGHNAAGGIEGIRTRAIET